MQYGASSGGGWGSGIGYGGGGLWGYLGGGYTIYTPNPQSEPKPPEEQEEIFKAKANSSVVVFNEAATIQLVVTTPTGATVTGSRLLDPLNSIILLNDNFDEGLTDPQTGDPIPDNSNDVALPSDPDLAKLEITLHTSTPGQGTFTLSVPGAVKIFDTTGQPIPTTDLTVDLASPTGALAGVASGTVTILFEGVTSTPDVVFTASLSGAGANAIPREAHVSYLHMELAPDVLAVNSNFDEGRIDPFTGYAIPDCDDMPRVGLFSGAGNTLMALEAVRPHLDGNYSQGERITNNLHEGWFGVHPKAVEDEFWDGATVTIRKIDRIDEETSHRESGQVRFYAKWGDGPSEYRGIPAYDFATLHATNLVTGGINRAASESVYGSRSVIPEDAIFYMEGVHPGKITLEWRYEKGSMVILHEQSFEVLTQKSVGAWRLELDYKIRLDTNNDPSGQIRTIEFPLLSDGYKKNMERASEFYDFYRECYLEPLRSNPDGYPNALSWAGLARLAGSQVVGGLSDSQYGNLALKSLLTPTHLPIVGPIVENWVSSEIEELQTALFVGGWQIFTSIGWQHHAYRSSGYRAIEHVADVFEDDDAVELAIAWKELHQGVLDHDPVLINRAALRMTDREQNHTIVPTWTAIAGMTSGPFLEFMFSLLGKNSCTPSGIDFSDLYPQIPVSTGSLANTADRWHWIDSATPNGILDTWNTEPLPRKLSLTRAPMRLDAERFSILSGLSGGIIPILCWDDDDTP